MMPVFLRPLLRRSVYDHSLAENARRLCEHVEIRHAIIARGAG
jgi:hypothetical protein